MSDPYFNNVKLLLRFDGANNSTTFIDESNNHYVPVITGTPKISTANSKFGGSSLYLDGSSYLTIDPTNNVRFTGTGDFCIEFWANVDNHGYNNFVTQGSYYNTNNALTMMYGYNTLYVGDTINGTFNWVHASGNPAFLNTWGHIAYVRLGNLLTVYVNGISIGTSNSAPNITSCDSPLRIGFGPTWGNVVGYIDELRITVGVPRYTSNFTPTVIPFQDMSLELYFGDYLSYSLFGTYQNNRNDSIETIDSISDNRTYYPAQSMTAGMSDKMTPFKGLKVCIQNQQSVTNYGIFGNVQECHKIIFVNYNNEVSATIIPELNGNYAFYSNTENEPFDVIFVTNNITKNNILYQNVKPLDISKSTLP